MPETTEERTAEVAVVDERSYEIAEYCPLTGEPYIASKCRIKPGADESRIVIGTAEVAIKDLRRAIRMVEAESGPTLRSA